ncbi:uncharacterized protein LOC143024909 isoform X2 [Oratosquilla oratoria]|uniref:uncharacterized protein LOC143024909 isoform X2 n=1 Tax=Oratosquilla oratoria TaxID=337810 RepID=UPI003F75AE0B
MLITLQEREEPLLCLVCGERDGTIGVFQRVGGTLHCRDPVIQRLGRILQKSIVEIELRSEVMCRLCITLMQDYERLEFSLVELQRKVIQSYRKSASVFKKTSCEQIDEVNEEAEIKIEKNSKCSPAWDHFDKVLDEDGNIVKVHCNICDRFLVYSNNTSGMILHLRAVHNIKIQPKSVIAEEIERPAKRFENWEYFEEVYDEKGEIVKVKCTICEQLLSYRNNTSGMMRHLREIHKKKLTSRMFTDELVEVHAEPFETDPSIENIVMKEENNYQMTLEVTEMLDGSGKVVEKEITDETKSRKSSTWDHFAEVQDKNGRKGVQCKYCQNFLSFDKNTSGMIRHLQSNHNIHLKDQMYQASDVLTLELSAILDDIGQIQERTVEDKGVVFQKYPRRSQTWDHFEKIFKDDGSIYKVKCHHCDQVISFPNNTSGMVRHLRLVHDIHHFGSQMLTTEPEMTLELSASQDGFTETTRKHSVESKKQGKRSAAWDHFKKMWNEKQKVHKVKCNHCHDIMSFPNNTSSMIRHLRDVHGIRVPTKTGFFRRTEVQRNLSALWNYYEKIVNDEGRIIQVECCLCHAVMNSQNLKGMITHLEDNHGMRLFCRKMVGLPPGQIQEVSIEHPKPLNVSKIVIGNEKESKEQNRSLGRGKNKRKRSPTWDYFEEIQNEEGRIIKVECHRCHAIMNFPNNTSGMLRHLRDVHGLQFLCGTTNNSTSYAQEVPVKRSKPFTISDIRLGNEKETIEQNISIARKKKRKRSLTWDYFEKILNKEGRIIKVRCHYCHVVMNFQNNTSGMIRHLRDVHGLKLFLRTICNLDSSRIQEKNTSGLVQHFKVEPEEQETALSEDDMFLDCEVECS